jgi:hypothetical protein
MRKTRRKIRYAELANGVLSVPFFQPSFCKLVVAQTRRLSWTAAQIQEAEATGELRIYSQPTTRFASILNSSRAAAVYDEFDRQINEVAKPLIKQIWRIELGEHSGTQMIRYRKGGHYLPHSDAGRDLPERYFTVVCYLNDDFEGGRTSFPSLDSVVKPKAGRAIVFPSRYLHCAEPVSEGEKFVLITWVCGPVPINWI